MYTFRTQNTEHRRSDAHLCVTERVSGRVGDLQSGSWIYYSLFTIQILSFPAARCPLPAARCPLPAARCPL